MNAMLVCAGSKSNWDTLANAEHGGLVNQCRVLTYANGSNGSGVPVGAVRQQSFAWPNGLITGNVSVGLRLVARGAASPTALRQECGRDREFGVLP